MDAFGIWNSNSYTALVLAASKHGFWFLSFEITQ